MVDREARLVNVSEGYCNIHLSEKTTVSTSNVEKFFRLILISYILYLG